jgi:hypothetical protein
MHWCLRGWEGAVMGAGLAWSGTYSHRHRARTRATWSAIWRGWAAQTSRWYDLASRLCGVTSRPLSPRALLMKASRVVFGSVGRYVVWCKITHHKVEAVNAISVRLSVCQSVGPSVRPSIRLSVCLFVCIGLCILVCWVCR